MQPYQQRVIEEKNQLDLRLDALNEFIANSDAYKNLPFDEQERLEDQAQIMFEYSNILGERIANFVS